MSIESLIGFIVTAMVYLATVSVLFGKILATGTYVREGMDKLEMALDKIRMETNSNFLRLEMSLQKEALHGVELSGRTDALEYRMTEVEREK